MWGRPRLVGWSMDIGSREEERRWRWDVMGLEGAGGRMVIAIVCEDAVLGTWTGADLASNLFVLQKFARYK